MPSIFDLVQAKEMAAYWTANEKDREPYIGDELFPSKQILGLNIKWIKGAKKTPVVMMNSAFDANVVPLPRIGFDMMQAQMPFFKNSKPIDEELRMMLNILLESGNQAMIDTVMQNIFDDEMSLLESAAVARERMRMMALTTGVVALSSNGQSYTFDYGVTHKGEATVSWSDPSAKIITDILAKQSEVYSDTGVKPTRAMCNLKTFTDMMNNEEIKKSAYVWTNGVGPMTEDILKSLIKSVTGVDVYVNDKRYTDEANATKKFVGDDIFVLMPPTTLGNTYMGTTPEQSDLMSLGKSNVAIVDNGVAITTMAKEDPVQVETKVSQICLPSFPAADQICILDTKQGS